MDIAWKKASIVEIIAPCTPSFGLLVAKHKIAVVRQYWGNASETFKVTYLDEHTYVHIKKKKKKMKGAGRGGVRRRGKWPTIGL